MSSLFHSEPRLYDQSYVPAEQTEYKSPKVHYAYSQDSDMFIAKNERRTSSLQPPRDSIGWSVPSTIIGAFLLAIGIAAAHYNYCLYLNNRFVDDTIPQSWNNALSVTFAHTFATALATSASTAFTQLLWRYLRQRPLSIARIDALFCLNTSSLNLYRLSLLKATPVLWFGGLLIPLVSIATIFPPGTLLVQQLPNNRTTTNEVYTLDVYNRGDGSAADFFSYAYFNINRTDGTYVGPDRYYSLIGERAIREGVYNTAASTCGSNCSYSLEFSAPSLDCKEGTPNPHLESMLWEYFKNTTQDADRTSTWNSRDAQYMAAAIRYADAYKFEISYRWEPREKRSGLKNISCTVMDAVYKTDIRYLNSTQNVDATVKLKDPLNATVLSQAYLFDQVVQSAPSETKFKNTNNANLTMAELDASFHDTQLRTIGDALMRALAGAVSGFGTDNYYTTRTIIEDTNLAQPIYEESQYAYTDIYFNLTAAGIEKMMTNIVISIMNSAMDPIDVPTVVTSNEAAYLFKSPYRLLAAYGGALAMCFAFCISGYIALHLNGSAASSGGFLQVMCTTTHGESVMNQLAKEASLSRRNGLPKELTQLKVRFGVVTDSATDRQHAAFGTVEETEPLARAS